MPDPMDNGSLVERARRATSAPPLPMQKQIRKTGLAVLSDLQEGLMRGGLLDFTLITREKEELPTSRFILMLRSSVWEEKFKLNPKLKELALDYSAPALRVALEYVISDDLTQAPLALSEDADGVRGLVQLSRFGDEFKIFALFEEAFRMLRMRINRSPALALAAFDEIADESPLEPYILQIIQDHPFDALTSPLDGPGVRYLRSSRLESLLRIDTLALEEIEFFNALITWVDLSSEEKAREHAEHCALFIQLRFIEPSELLTTVKDSELVEHTSILEAMADQALEAQLGGREFSNYRGNQRVERVVVRNSGLEDVNGIYERQGRDDYCDYEALYLKSSERRQGECGLYFWNGTWNIAPAADLSNLYYSCESGDLKLPNEGWTVCHKGVYPVPTFRVLPKRNMRNNSRAVRASLPACFRNSEEYLGN